MIKKDKFTFTAPLEESGGVSSSALGRCGRRENVGKLSGTFSCLSLVVRRRMTWWWRVDSWAKLLGSYLCSTLLAVWPGTYYFTSLHLIFLIYKAKVTQPHRIFLRTKRLNTCKVFRVWLSKCSMSVVYGDDNDGNSLHSPYPHFRWIKSPYPFLQDSMCPTIDSSTQ